MKSYVNTGVNKDKLLANLCICNWSKFYVWKKHSIFHVTNYGEHNLAFALYLNSFYTKILPQYISEKWRKSPL